MPRYVAFLRAINVGGRFVSMADLAAHFESFGLEQVETFIASGNVIFQSRLAPVTLEGRIADGLKARLGYDVATFVRSEAEVAAVATCTPWPAAAIAAAGAFNVSFVAHTLTAAQQKALAARNSDIDALMAVGREVYWLCAVKQSDSRFSNAVLERTIGTPGTLRGMNTVQRLAKKLGVL
ncbi:MAG: DUF1697 domain-containing protein [Thermoflexales bacterium]|nr:DUF1697 domain-containing protein [Thermoflexales bacterium]